MIHAWTSRFTSRVVSAIARFRSISLRRIAIASILLSIGVVASHLPARWNGGRTAEVADIPLRPLTPQEAAAMMGTTDETRLLELTRFDHNKVTGRTHVYLIPEDPAAGECPRILEYHKRKYQICSSSWENFHNVHVINRSALEKELGRRLTERDLARENSWSSRASFASNRVAVYFAIEVLFLSILLIALVSVLQRIHNPLLIPPIFVVAGATALVFLAWYSPAFYDADWFYQRIALEELIGGRGVFGWSSHVVLGVALMLSAVSVPLLLLQLLVRGGHRLTGYPPARIRGVLIAMVALACAALLFTKYQRYREQRAQALIVMARVEPSLRPELLRVLTSDPAMSQHQSELLSSKVLSPSAMRVADEVLSATGPGSDLRVFVPLHDGWHIFLHSAPTFNYADVRQLRTGEHQYVSDIEVVEPLLRTGKSYEASFLKYLDSEYLSGRAFRGPGGRVEAVALVSDAN